MHHFYQNFRKKDKNGIVFEKKGQFSYISSLLGMKISCPLPLTSRESKYQIQMTLFFYLVVIKNFTKIFKMAAVQERFEEKRRILMLIIIIDGQLMMNLIMKIDCFFFIVIHMDDFGKAKRKIS